MAAGSVSAPLILPLVSPTQRNKITTQTRVCLHSSSPGAEIFFTLDGSKPDSSSEKYKSPILLCPGPVCVRATARTSDFRESSTVTKFFVVNDVVESDPTNHSPPLIPLTNDSKAQLSVVPPPQLQDSYVTSYQSCAPQLRDEDLTLLKTLDMTEKNRIQREADFQRCPGCLALRPSDPCAVFCPLCGAALSAVPVTAPPTERAQVLRLQREHRCPGCLALRPSDPCAVFCPLCGAALPPPTERTQVTSCVVCASLLPVLSESCFVCDTKVCPPPPSYFCESAPCDTQLHCTCLRCGAFRPSPAHFCSSCGFRAPPPHSPAANQVVRTDTGQVPPPAAPPAPPTADHSTQTVGLHFPSATALKRLGQEEKRRGRGGVSPGRGFWRQQVDHVCAHLRSHAQNHAPFRTLLGEPRLGRLVSAVVQDDPQEVTLTLTFAAVATTTTSATCTDPVRPEGGDITPSLSHLH